MLTKQYIGRRNFGSFIIMSEEKHNVCDILIHQYVEELNSFFFFFLFASLRITIVNFSNMGKLREKFTLEMFF